MFRARLAVLLALAFSGCMDAADIFLEENPPDVIINHECPCGAGSGSHDVYITEEITVAETVYVTEEDTTPDVVQEFYGDASSLPVLLLEGTGNPMPKKLTILDAATEVNPEDQIYLAQAGASKRVTVAIAFVPTNYVGGLLTSNDVSDIIHDIAIAPGIARSADDTTSLRLASILTKQIDAAWAVGDDAGGMDTGAVAGDTLYAIWLIKNPTTGVVDALFSLSFSAPTMPAGYTKKRLIAAVLTQSTSQIIPYVQSGDFFQYMASPIVDINDASITDKVFETGVLSVPPLCMAHISGAYENLTASDPLSGGISIKPKGSTASANEPTAFLYMRVDANSDEGTARGTILVNASKEIEYTAIAPSGAATIIIETHGFTMLTRREPQ